jgi:hypothetical protein
MSRINVYFIGAYYVSKSYTLYGNVLILMAVCQLLLMGGSLCGEVTEI